MTARRVLVAGIGNVFFGDDGFGVEVARRLAARPPAGAHVVDFGIRGLDLAYALLDGYHAAVLVDALPRGGTPGTLYVLEPALDADAPPALEPHGMDPRRVLALARALGGPLPALRVLGCEPAPLPEPDAMVMGLSDAVAAAVPQAVELAAALVAELRDGMPAHA